MFSSPHGRVDALIGLVGREGAVEVVGRIAGGPVEAVHLHLSEFVAGVAVVGLVGQALQHRVTVAAERVGRAGAIAVVDERDLPGAFLLLECGVDNVVLERVHVGRKVDVLELSGRHVLDGATVNLRRTGLGRVISGAGDLLRHELRQALHCPHGVGQPGALARAADALHHVLRLRLRVVEPRHAFTAEGLERLARDGVGLVEIAGHHRHDGRIDRRF